MSDKNHIDRLFRDRLAGRRAAYNPAHWKAMESMLDASEGRSRKGLWLWLFLPLLAGALAVWAVSESREAHAMKLVETESFKLGELEGFFASRVSGDGGYGDADDLSTSDRRSKEDKGMANRSDGTGRSSQPKANTEGSKGQTQLTRRSAGETGDQEVDHTPAGEQNALGSDQNVGTGNERSSASGPGSTQSSSIGGQTDLSSNKMADPSLEVLSDGASDAENVGNSENGGSDTQNDAENGSSEAGTTAVQLLTSGEAASALAKEGIDKLGMRLPQVEYPGLIESSLPLDEVGSGIRYELRYRAAMGLYRNVGSLSSSETNAQVLQDPGFEHGLEISRIDGHREMATGLTYFTYNNVYEESLDSTQTWQFTETLEIDSIEIEIFEVIDSTYDEVNEIWLVDTTYVEIADTTFMTVIDSSLVQDVTEGSLVQRYYQQSYLELPILFGRRFEFGRWQVSMMVGPSFVYSTRVEGVYIDGEEVSMRSAAVRRFNVFARAELATYYSLTHQWKLFVHAGGRYSLSSTLRSEGGNERLYGLWGGAGVSYTIPVSSVRKRF